MQVKDDAVPTVIGRRSESHQFRLGSCCWRARGRGRGATNSSASPRHSFLSIGRFKPEFGQVGPVRAFSPSAGFDKTDTYINPLNSALMRLQCIFLSAYLCGQVTEGTASFMHADHHILCIKTTKERPYMQDNCDREHHLTRAEAHWPCVMPMLSAPRQRLQSHFQSNDSQTSQRPTFIHVSRRLSRGFQQEAAATSYRETEERICMPLQYNRAHWRAGQGKAEQRIISVLVRWKSAVIKLSLIPKLRTRHWFLRGSSGRPCWCVWCGRPCSVVVEEKINKK